MEQKLLEIELDEINTHHAAYERAHARLVVLAIGLAIGIAIALLVSPMLLWPKGTARIDPSSTWPLLLLATFWVAMTINVYIARQRSFREVRAGCLKLRRAGYRIRKQDVHFSGSAFGVSDMGQSDRNSVDVGRLSARSLHTVMQ